MANSGIERDFRNEGECEQCKGGGQVETGRGIPLPGLGFRTEQKDEENKRCKGKCGIKGKESDPPDER